jgi:type II secretory pathway pseudopilin PulG
MINKKIKNNKISGFTLIEAMFAIFILTFSVSVLMGVVASNLFAAKYAGDEITANYLLQEVIDYVRNDRDTVVLLEGQDWDIFYKKYEEAKCLEDSGWCTIDLSNPTDPLKNCPDGVCPPLSYDKDLTNRSFYNYNVNDGIESNFTRKLKIEKNLLNKDEIEVTVMVSWYNGDTNRSKILKTSLLKWQ